MIKQKATTRKHSYYIGLIFLFLIPSLSIAQQFDQSVFSTQGNYNKSLSMSLSWTIGDLAISTIDQEEKSLTQGFQQPSLTIKEIRKPGIAVIDASVFPNPTRGEITVRLNQNAPFKFTLYDSLGRLLKAFSSEESSQQIEMGQYDEGIYLLRIQNTNTSVQSLFEIIKL